MGRTEKRPPASGRRWWRRAKRAAASISLVSVAFYVLLLIALYARPVAAFASALVLVAGAWERVRGDNRRRDRAYEPLRSAIETEIGQARLQVLAGALLLAATIFLPPAVVVGLGLAASGFLLVKGAAHSATVSSEEEDRGLLKNTAAQECSRIDRLARAASRVRILPGFGRIPDAADYEAPREHISVLRTVSLFLLYCSCGLFLLTGAALGVATVAPLPSMPLPPRVEVDLFGGDEQDPESKTDPPSYAELCPAIPNPLDIGHHLGPLFRHDGAIKAGCGTVPRRVADTGTWVAPGYCGSELRSLAISAPGEHPAIVYGTPARIAWAAALAGKLVAVEVAEPNEGDVYLMATREGTYGFARPTRSIEEDPGQPRSCSQVRGVARSFATLQPALVNLWVELMRRRAEWTWPKPRQGEPGSVIFTDRMDASVVAEGHCDSAECWIETDGDRWPEEGTGFVSLPELAPFMPPPSGG